MKKFKLSLIFVSVLIISTMIFCVPDVYAMEALNDYKGRTAGYFIAGSGGAVLESADININVPELPEASTHSSAYESEVVADYVFYNPLSVDRTAVVCFDYYDVPEYVSYYDDYRNVYFDGAEATFEKRYSPPVKNREDAVSFASALGSAYQPQGDIPSDTAVYVHTYEIRYADVGEDEELYACFTAERRSQCIFGVSATVNERRMNIKVENGRFTLITLGTQFGDAYPFYFTRTVGGSELVQTDYELVNVRERTFESYINSHIDDMEIKDDEVRQDLYACYCAKIENAEYRIFSESEFFAKDYRTWNKTETVIPAQGRITMRVQEPFFPWILEVPSPDVYPVQVAVPYAVLSEGFKMDISVKTPYYIVGKHEFLKTSDGYSLTANILGKEYLSFSMCESSDPDYEPGSAFWPFIVFVLLPTLLAIIVIAVITLILGAAGIIACFAVAAFAVLLVVFAIVKLVKFIAKKAKGDTRE